MFTCDLLGTCGRFHAGAIGRRKTSEQWDHFGVLVWGVSSRSVVMVCSGSALEARVFPLFVTEFYLCGLSIEQVSGVV